MYTLRSILVAGVWLHRVPHYTAWMLIVIGLIALLVGLVFRQARAFCEAFCPARALLSVYGRYTPVQLDVCDPAVCEQCKTRDCVASGNCHRFDRRSCPSLVRVFRREQADNCVLCVQCAKVCPYDNVGLGLVGPEARVRRHRLLLLLLAVIGWPSWHWTREAADEQLPAARAGFVIVSAVFCLSLAVWPWF